MQSFQFQTRLMAFADICHQNSHLILVSFILESYLECTVSGWKVERWTGSGVSTFFSSQPYLWRVMHSVLRRVMCDPLGDHWAPRVYRRTKSPEGGSAAGNWGSPFIALRPARPRSESSTPNPRHPFDHYLPRLLTTYPHFAKYLPSLLYSLMAIGHDPLWDVVLNVLSCHLCNVPPWQVLTFKHFFTSASNFIWFWVLNTKTCLMWHSDLFVILRQLGPGLVCLSGKFWDVSSVLGMFDTLIARLFVLHQMMQNVTLPTKSAEWPFRCLDYPTIFGEFHFTCWVIEGSLLEI